MIKRKRKEDQKKEIANEVDQESINRLNRKYLALTN